MLIDRTFFLFRTSLTSAIAACLVMFASLNVFAQEQSPNPVVPEQAESRDPLYDSRVQLLNHQKKYYKACSIYIYIRSFINVDILKLSTFKIGSCPAAEFRSITAASVIAQLQTIAPITLVSMVGPYFQLMDENNSVIESASLSIGNMNFSPVMSAEIGFKDLLTNFKAVFKWSRAEVAYNPIGTKRNMNFVWYKGSMIYTLISDKGKQYVMVYFTPADADKFSSEQEITDKLNDLPNVLNPPPGWRFEKIKLDKVLRLQQIPYQGKASEVLMDELENVYMHLDTNKELLVSNN